MENIKSPFFSIAIPVYNGEKYIAECIASIQRQTFSDFEIVAVNDGSVDKTGEILKSISEKDPRVKVITLENGGVFRARAAGARESCGVYLTFCDDDDVYSDKRAFEKIYERAKSEEFSLIQCGYYKKFNHVRVKDNPVKKEIRADRNDFYEKDYPLLLSSRNIESRLMVNTLAKFYHKSLYKNAPDPDGLERMFMGDDMILNLFILKDCQSALYLPDAYYCSFRLRGNSGKYRRDEMHNLDIIKKYQLAFLENWDGKKKSQVERLHHFETADWMLLHVRNSIENIGEEQTVALIKEVLELPCFIRAAKYFKAHPEETLPVKLLLCGDAEKYVEAAKSSPKPTLKARLYEWIKKNIVYKI